jgi:hypothetical protein
MVSAGHTNLACSVEEKQNWTNCALQHHNNHAVQLPTVHKQLVTDPVNLTLPPRSNLDPGKLGPAPPRPPRSLRPACEGLHLHGSLGGPGCEAMAPLRGRRRQLAALALLAALLLITATCLPFLVSRLAGPPAARHMAPPPPWDPPRPELAVRHLIAL